MTARGTAILLVALTVLAPACGESRERPSVASYEEGVLAHRDRVDLTLERVTTARSLEEFLERMDEAASTIKDAADDLERLGAPARYESEHADLVASFTQLAFDVQATADQIRQPGFDELLSGARGLSFESWDEVNRALGALRLKGVRVTLLERHSGR